jgi:hypothetical protein
LGPKESHTIAELNTSYIPTLDALKTRKVTEESDDSLIAAKHAVNEAFYHLIRPKLLEQYRFQGVLIDEAKVIFLGSVEECMVARVVYQSKPHPFVHIFTDFI